VSRAGAGHVEVARLLGALVRFGPVLAVKIYRLTLERPPLVPVLPCLDHEAMLHQGIAPHVAVYVQDEATGGIHELVFIPARRRIEVDTISTWGESSPDSHARLLEMLSRCYPEYRVHVKGPSWWRGERRVATACRAQVTLRDVLSGADISAVRTAIERLQTIGALMEKQSRVASWGVRTVTGPLLAGAGVVLFLVLGEFRDWLGDGGVTALRYGFVGLLGASFLYLGLKAVQLTDMSNRVWKRTAEYSLILAERRRLESLRPGVLDH
jgi:hypothetical protein